MIFKPDNQFICAYIYLLVCLDRYFDQLDAQTSDRKYQLGQYSISSQPKMTRDK